MKTSAPILGFLAFVASPAASASCERAALVQLTSRYIAAQSLGEPRYLAALSESTAYSENFKPVNLTDSILRKPLKIDFHRSVHDPVTCSTFTEVVVADPSHRYVIGTQMRADSAGAGAGLGLALASVESLVTDEGDWLFNATHTLHYALRESWEPIPEARRDSRAVLQAAADAYLDLFKKGPGSVDVPWADDCRRLEGGLYTAPGDTCNSGVPSGVDLVNRRYVIDEVMGVVDVFLTFGAGGLPDSHEFRVEGGKLRFVHTITVCAEPNCGFGDPPAQLLEDLGFD
jgi:hypothetical protein